MRRLLIVPLLLIVAVPLFAKRRAVHVPAAKCSFSLAPTWNGNVPAAGITRGVVLVFGQTPECSGWAAYSSVPWATVEGAPRDAQPTAYVTITANPDTTPRTTQLIIAGVRLVVTQDGAPAVSPPVANNLIVNGTFDRNIAPWGWQARFPNGIGVAQWSQFDANGSPASGSILLRDDDGNLAFQQLQCVRVNANTTYRFGAKVRSFEGVERGEGIMAVFTYLASDCSGQFTSENIQLLRPAERGVWQEFSFRARTRSNIQGMIVVIAAAANVAPYEIWFDDVFLRLE